MRVLYLTHRLPYAPNRGDRVRAYHTLRVLGQVADIDLISLAHDDAEAGRAADIAHLVSSVRVAPVSRWRNLARAAAALPSSRPLTHVLLDAPDVDRLIEQAVTAHPPDVVLAFCSGMARFALTPPLDRFPFVLDMVDVDSAKWEALAAARHMWDAKGLVFRRESRLLRRFEDRAARSAHSTLVINDRERTALGAIPDARVEIVGTGVDAQALRPAAPPAGEPTVVFCGVMNYEPNERAVVWFIEAVWPLVLAAHPGARLSIVGADPTDRLIAIARNHTSVQLTGTVPDVKPYLWRAALSIAPLFIARGLQTKVIEAVAAGLPVVATPEVMKGIPREVAPACSVAQTAEMFAAAVTELLTLTPHARRARAQSANLDGLTWERSLAPLVGALQDAASHGAAARRRSHNSS